MSEVVFKVYSGLHIGALIELADGTWVFGSDDSADIILSDEGIAARHAAFVVHGSAVRADALDAPVLLASTGEAPSGGEILPGTLFRIGRVTLAWGALDADENFWLEVDQAFAALSAPHLHANKANEGQSDNSDANKAESAEGNTSDSESLDDAVTSDSSEASSDDDIGNEEKSSETNGAGKKRFMLSLLTLALLIGGGFGVTHYMDGAKYEGEGWVSIAEEKPSFFACAKERLAQAGLFGELLGPEPERVEADFRGMGLNGVTVTRVDNGTYRFAGSVPDDAARMKLLTVAKSFKWPVVLDIAVESDYTNAYRAAFNTLGFWPDVKFERQNEATVLVVASYMISNVVEEKTFGDVAGMVPHLDAPGTAITVKRIVRYSDDVEKWVAKALADEKLAGVTTEYLPGTIRFKTTLTPEVKKKLDHVMTQVKAASDVPLVISVVNVPAEQKPVVVASKLVPPAPKKTGGAPAFKVTGISGGAIKFVTLSSGEKVFQGGKLPGGWRLDAVKDTHLEISRGKEKKRYPLKEKP